LHDALQSYFAEIANDREGVTGEQLLVSTERRQAGQAGTKVTKVARVIEVTNERHLVTLVT
jgi:hypothetical protein